MNIDNMKNRKTVNRVAFRLTFLKWLFELRGNNGNKM